MAKGGNTKEQVIQLVYQSSEAGCTARQHNVTEEQRLKEHTDLAKQAEKELANASKKERNEVANLEEKYDKLYEERSKSQTAAAKQDEKEKLVAAKKAFDARKHLNAEVNALLDQLAKDEDAKGKKIAREKEKSGKAVDDAAMDHDHKVRVKLWSEDQEALQKQARERRVLNNSILGAKSVGMFAAGIADSNSATALLTNVIEHFNQVRLVGCQTANDVNRYAANLQSLSALEGHLGMPSPAMESQLRPRLQTPEAAASFPAIQATPFSGVYRMGTRDQINAKMIAELPGGAIGEMFEQGVGNDPLMAQERANIAKEMTDIQRGAGIGQWKESLTRQAHGSLAPENMPLPHEDVMIASASGWQEMVPGYRRRLEWEARHRVLAEARKAGPQAPDTRRIDAKNGAVSAEDRLGWEALYGLSQQSRVGVGQIAPGVDLNRMARAMEDFTKAIENFMGPSGEALPSAAGQAPARAGIPPAALATLPPPFPGRLDALRAGSW